MTNQLEPSPHRGRLLPAGSIGESDVRHLMEQVINGGMVSARAGHALIPTGFTPLDKALGGGLHVGDLCVIGGLPASGKTIAALQWARNMARAGNVVLYLCYEHDVATLLGRLLALEIGDLPGRIAPGDAAAVHEALSYTMNGAGDPSSAVMEHPAVRLAMAKMAAYASRLVLSQASHDCDLGAIERKAQMGAFDVVVVDYLQKVPEPGLSGVDRHAATIEGLKDLALAEECLVLAVSAVESGALEDRRLRLDGLRGAHVLAHEADVIVILNGKLNIVSRAHIAFDSTLVEDFRRQVVFTVEKNRRGSAPIDTEFSRDFAHFRFESGGRYVSEQLIDDVVVRD